MFFIRAFVVFLACLIAGIFPSFAEQTVRIGAYEFTPFVEIDSSGQISGVLPELVREIAAVDPDRNYEIVVTSARRRYRDMTSGRIDAIIFEDPEWGWDDYLDKVRFSNELLVGGERYVALRIEGRDQTFFDDMHHRRIGGIFGYHYGFADFNSNPKFLKHIYDIRLLDSPRSLLLALEANEVEVAVLRTSWLARHFRDHPGVIEKFLVSDRADQTNSLRIVTGNNAPISSSGILENINKAFKTKGIWSFWIRQGIVLR